MGQVERLFQALKEIARASASPGPPSQFLAPVVRTTATALNIRGCSLLLLDSQRKSLIHMASHGLSERYIHKGLLEAERSLAEVVDGKPVAITRVAQDPRVQFSHLAVEEGVVSILGVPVRTGGEVVGSIRVYSRTQRQFTELEVEFLSTVAEVVGAALEPRPRQPVLEPSSSSIKETAPPSIAHQVRAPAFAHPSEEEFARLLDFYQIEWFYEPRSFVLEEVEGKAKEMFTPDFYLPGLSLYIELTTMKGELVKDKRRKIRRLRELYPGVAVKLLSKKDYDRLLAKYGYGPLAQAKAMGIGPVLFTREQLQKRVRELARDISEEYRGQHPILLGVLRGVFCFMADLMRHISIPVDLDFMAISYYGEGSAAVKITKDLDVDITNRQVVLVEDIVDTGMTLGFVLAHLRSRRPASVAVCALLDKRVRRLAEVPLKWVGFEVPDEFLVGYGLDYQEQYRNLPYIAILKPEAEREERKKPGAKKNLG